MFEVICIDNTKLPEGAILTKDKLYMVEKELINSYGEKTYVISGIVNEGVTKLGLKWFGYKASRFARLTKDNKSLSIEKEMVILN